MGKIVIMTNGLDSNFTRKSLVTAQKMKFSFKDFFSKCDQIRKKLWIRSQLLKKSFVENFIFCAVGFVRKEIFIVDS